MEYIGAKKHSMGWNYSKLYLPMELQIGCKCWSDFYSTN